MHSLELRLHPPYCETHPAVHPTHPPAPAPALHKPILQPKHTPLQAKLLELDSLLGSEDTPLHPPTSALAGHHTSRGISAPITAHYPVSADRRRQYFQQHPHAAVGRVDDVRVTLEPSSPLLPTAEASNAAFEASAPPAGASEQDRKKYLERMKRLRGSIL